MQVPATSGNKPINQKLRSQRSFFLQFRRENDTMIKSEHREGRYEVYFNYRIIAYRRNYNRTFAFNKKNEWENRLLTKVFLYIGNSCVNNIHYYRCNYAIQWRRIVDTDTFFRFFNNFFDAYGCLPELPYNI